MTTRTSVSFATILLVLFTFTAAFSQPLEHIVWAKADSGHYNEAAALAFDAMAEDSTLIDVLYQGVRAALNSPQRDEFLKTALADRSPNFVNRMRRAIILEETGRFQQALVTLDSLRHQYPFCGIVWRYAALLAEADRLSEAEALLLPLVNSECRTQVIRELARVNQIRSDYDRSDSLFKELEGLGTSPFTGANGIAFGVIRRGHYREGIEMLRRQCAEYDVPFSHYSLAFAFKLMECPSEAWKVLQDALVRFPNSVRLIAEAIEVGSQLGYTAQVDSLAARLTPSQRAHQGVTALAARAKALDDTLAFYSETEALIKAGVWRDWVIVDYLYELRERGRGAEADRWLDTIMHSVNALDQAYVQTSLAMRTSAAAALDSLAPYAQQFPESPYLQSLRARYMYLAGDTDAGRNLIDSLLVNDPGGWYLLATIYWLESSARQFDKATVCLDRLNRTAYAPEVTIARRVQLLHDQGNIPEAERLLDSARSISHGDPDLMWYCSTIYSHEDKKEKLHEATEEYLQSSRLPFTHLPILIGLLRQSEQFTVAESLCTAYLAKYPNAAALYNERGITRYAAGDYDAASADVTRAKELNPFNETYNRSGAATTPKAVPLDQSAGKTAADTTGLIRVSVDSLFALRKKVKANPTDECVVLRDFNQYIYFTDGRKIRRMHRVLVAMNSSGAENLGSISLSFSAYRETPRVILARTIQPNRSIKEVPPSDIYISNIGGGLTDSRVLQWAFPQVDSGSIVEALVQFEESNVIPEGINDHMYFTESYPLVSTGYELYVPSIWSIISRTSKGVTLDQKKSGEQIIYRWSVPAQPAFIYEDDQPSLSEQAEWLHYCYKKTWAEEASTYWQKAVVKIDTSQTVRDLFTRLTKDAGTQRDTLAALYRFVADSIRYEAINFGDGTIIPREATSTLGNAFGDCKDKAILLISLLRIAGLNGYGALVSTGDRQLFHSDVPDMGQFNHMIVYAPGTATPWLDATCSQCEFGDIPGSIADRKALIVGSDLPDPLIDIPDSPAAHDQLYRRITFDPQAAGGCTITNHLTFTGPTGQILRGNMAQPGDVASTRSFVEGQASAGITRSARLVDYSAPPRTTPGLSYDFSARFTADEMFHKDQNYAVIELNLYSISSLLTRPDTTGRRLDIEFDHLVKVTDETTIAPSAHWQLFGRLLPWRWETPWFVAACSSLTVGDSLRAFTSFELTRRRIPRDSLKEFNDLLDKMNVRFSNQSIVYRRAPDSSKIAAMEAAIAASPEDMSLYSTLARIYIGEDGGGKGCFGLENRTKAREVLDRALKHDSTNEGILLLSAVLAIEEKKYHQAESLFAAMPQGGQFGLLVTGMLGQIYAETGRFSESVAAMERMMSVSPDNGIRSTIAMLHCRSGELEKAKKQIETLELLKADSSDLVHAKYYYEVARKDWKAAEKLVEVWPDTATAVRRTLMVELMNRQQDWSGSAETARLLLKEEPESVWGMNNLAWSLFKMNSQLDTALILIERTILLDGGCEANTRNTRGAILLALGRLDEAEEDFQFSLHDESAKAQTTNLYYLGLLASKRGQKDVARSYFERAVAANGGDEELELARQALTTL